MHMFVYAGQKIFLSNVVAYLCVAGFYTPRQTEQCCSDTFAQFVFSHVMTTVSL